MVRCDEFMGLLRVKEAAFTFHGAYFRADKLKAQVRTRAPIARAQRRTKKTTATCVRAQIARERGGVARGGITMLTAAPQWRHESKEHAFSVYIQALAPPLVLVTIVPSTCHQLANNEQGSCNRTSGIVLAISEAKPHLSAFLPYSGKLSEV